MRDTTTPQRFRSMEGKTPQLGRMTMAFKRPDGEVERSYSMFESSDSVPADGLALRLDTPATPVTIEHVAVEPNKQTNLELNKIGAPGGIS